jgi:hypothetical protein
MGGGNSKQEKVIKNEAALAKKEDPDAFANYKGPTSKPVLEHTNSPIKSAQSKPILAQTDD